MCAGLANVEKKSAWPRMHDKFLLFRFKDTPAGPDDLRNDNYEYGKQVRFDTVFTGSYNITMNAANSIENSLIITQQPIIDGYYEEFERIFGISEPLDWNSKWVNPRYRIGT